MTPPASLQQPAPPGSESCLPTPEQIFQNIKQEYNRYQRWRHLEVVLSQSEACTSESQPSSSALTAPGSPGAFWMKKGQPTFTLRQVGIMCERLLKDYEIKSERSMSRSSVPNSQMYPEAFLPIWVPGVTSRDGCCTLFATGLISHFSSNFAS
uniref:Akirin 1 n=1 Tax=Mus spicilegus TaxID=10103 RepID=A0A8C6GVM9_MUSSI